MNQRTYHKADKATIYFIGVTTGKSSIMKVFPEWARYLGLGDCTIKGLDFVPHDQPEHYREAVAFIKSDPLSLGALVTTHKIDLLHACRDQFDELDEFAAMMGEISSISKRDGRLVGHAKDPITSGLSLDAFLPANHWTKTSAEALVLGAGGSAIAVTWHMMQPKLGGNRPSKIVVANRSTPRLDEIKHLHEQWKSGVPVEYVHVPKTELADALCAQLKPGSLVINATGLGKDGPGSPLTDAAVFPQNGLAWEFNYRGDLVFLRQARAQQQARNLRIEDGWIYFIHGWTRVVAEVFHVDIPVREPKFDELSRIAAAVRS
jgi:shikimate 5-dehydrogenase